MNNLSFKEQVKHLIEESFPGKYTMKIFMNHLLVLLPDENFHSVVHDAKRAFRALLDERMADRPEKILIDFKSDIFEDSLMIEKPV